MTRDYETLFIIRPDLTEDNIEKEIATVRDMITGDGGSIISEEKWGKKRLGFPIKKHRYGYYALIRHTSDSQLVAKLTRRFELNETSLKAMTVIFDGGAGRMYGEPPVLSRVEGEDVEVVANGEPQ
jgi:small subunit ribosomal protein S6